MVDVPEPHPDAPNVPIPIGQPLQEWLQSAARTLDVTTSLLAQQVHQIRHEGSQRAVHAVRSPHGQVVAYAVAHETWLDDRLVEVLVDARSPDPEAQRIAISCLDTAGVVGAACVRLAPQSESPQLEIGPAISAAWTLDACVTSLYENHVRAVLDLPLGAPRLLGRAVATCVVGSAPQMHSALRHCFARDPELRVHLYGTSASAGITIGHATVVAEDKDEALRRARHAADYLTGSIEE